MVKKSLWAVLFAQLLFTAATANGKVYYMSISEGGSTQNCWQNPLQWKPVYQKEGDVWVFSGEGPSEFTAEDDFVVPPHYKNFTLRSPGKGDDSALWTWKGKSLTLGDNTLYNNSKSEWCSILRVIIRGEDRYLKFDNDGLFLASRSILNLFEESTPIYNIKGSVTVTASMKDYPAIIQQTSDDVHDAYLNFHDKVKGGAKVYSMIRSDARNFTVSFSDVTEYYGTIVVTNRNDDASAAVSLGTDFPGTVSICTNTTLSAANDTQVNNLLAHDGAVIGTDISVKSLTVAGRIAIRTNVRVENLVMLENSAIDIFNDGGSLEITESLTRGAASRISVYVRNDPFANSPSEVNDVHLLRVGEGIDFDPEEIDVLYFDGTPLEKLCGYTLTRSTEGGVTVFAAKLPQTVALTKSDAYTYKKVTSSALTNATQWSNGMLPTDENTGYVVKKLEGKTTLFASATDENSDVSTFKGGSLVIDESYLIVAAPIFNVDRLVLRDGATLYFYAGLCTTINGSIVAMTGTSHFGAYGYETNTIAANLVGPGTIELQAFKGASATQSSCTYKLTGESYDFKGSMIVTIPYHMPADPVADYNKITPRFDRNYATLILTDKSNLGGALSAINRKSLTIENMSRVQPDEDVTTLTLDEPTRGIFIKWVGRLFAEQGQTFAVASPLAVHGTLWKEGAGTLVLDSPAPTFGADAESEQPDANATNRTFMVAGGDVRIASSAALNGLDVVFTNGAGRIVLDLDSEDEALRNFGIMNAKSPAPFAAVGDVKNVSVLLDLDNAPVNGASYPILTVHNSCRDAVFSSVKFRKSEALAGWTLLRSWRDNEDGTSTLMATATKCISIIIR